MTKQQKQILACVFFIPAIAGALVPSYLHLADWYQAWMPDGWERLSYVAALVTEAPVVACGVSAILMPAGFRVRLPVYALLVYSVAVSIYVNARWAWGHTQPPADPTAWWGNVLDVVLGSAVLPLFALFCELALDVVLRSVKDDTPARKTERQGERQPKRKAAQVTASSPEQAAPGGALAEKWRQAVKRHGAGKTLTELAQLEGVSRQAVGAWRKAATEGARTVDDRMASA